MELDPLAIRNLLIWIALALGNAILLGATPSWMRCGAKRADPSAAAALFSLVLVGVMAVFLALTGGAKGLLTLTANQYLALAACGLLSALTWLSLFTALTGGRVNKVIPVYLLWYAFSLTASHFLFGEPLGLWRICCVVVILLGIVFIESSSKNLGGQLWFVYALIAALTAAGTQLLKRGLLGSAFEETLFQAGRSAAACVILWIFVFIRGKQNTLGDLSPRGWIGISFAALSLAGSYACSYYASLRGDISELAPIGVLAFAFVMLFSRMFQKEKQPGSSVFGTALVLLGQFGILMGL
ncbi:MAG: EamA family transporter [Clostridiaceae bacterium]